MEVKNHLKRTPFNPACRLDRLTGNDENSEGEQKPVNCAFCYFEQGTYFDNLSREPKDRRGTAEAVQ
jgi:hypothetical protein